MRYVIACSMMTSIPMPMGTPAMICGQGFIFGEEVKANQNKPTVNRPAPMIMGGRRSSGSRKPLFVNFALMVVNV